MVGMATAVDQTMVVTRLELAGTCFEGLPDEISARLLARSRYLDVPAGHIVFPAADPSQHIGLVLGGTARSFLTAADGRQITLRYARRGAIVGKYSSVIGAHAPLGVQAITDCTVLEFDPDVFQALLATEISVASSVILELARRLEDVYAAAGDSAFGSVRQRLVRHLLALAGDGDPDAGYIAAISQQQLAEAIGSSREVVSRELRHLRDESLVRTSPREIELLSIERLAELLGHWQVDSPY
jgi:CRP/FNR family transcriptional regulator, cyclic AMP receptor protein